jgi:hypothetical protein
VLLHIPAYIGIVSTISQGPTELEYELRSLLRNLLVDILNDGRTRIALIVLVWNISKEEAETLTLFPTNKQVKSLISVTIPKRGGKGSIRGKGGRKVAIKKEVIKKEVKEEEEKVKVEEDINDNFLDVDKVIRGKQKYLQTSKYPKDKYNIN